MVNQLEVKAYKQCVDMQIREWASRGYCYPSPDLRPIEHISFNLRCGASTKATGNPCKRKDIYASGRCKLHGGLSTGPRTEEGKRKSAQNGFKAKSVRT